MNNLENNEIISQIGIDKNHIDTFQLETNDGTKRTKDKFHRNAVEQRNNYINKEQAIFNKYKITIENELLDRYKALMPTDKSLEYNEKLEEVSNLLDVVKINSSIPNSFKLRLDYIIAFINQKTSLEDLNKQIKNFIDKYQTIGINLTIEDFKYTMFTEMYMKSFLENNDSNVLKEIFEKIYFRCPDIELQLKMNLTYLIKKYEKKMALYVEKLKIEEFSKYQTNGTNIINKYIDYRLEVGNLIARDEYYNSSIFLDGKKKISDYLEGAAARDKNYNTFAINGNYNELSDSSKNAYNSAIMGLYVTLNELKKYYNYEFIIKELLDKYKNKDAVKGQFTNKQKEIDKEEKKREAIYKEYLKACGVGFLAKKNEVKMHDVMLKMNEQIKKLNDLYLEYKDLEITYKLSNLNDAASIFDLFMCSLDSFSFLEKCFTENEELSENGLVNNLDEYFRFIYNPNNNILRKINVFTDYDITSIVADKYKLLNLEISKESIDKDNIDSTLDTVSFINLIQNIEMSNITLHEIDLLCQMKEIIKDKLDNGDSEVI